MTLVQASNYNLLQPGKRTEYIILGNKVIYSMYGNQPKIKPKRNFFPVLKTDLDITTSIVTEFKSIKCAPAQYGYCTNGLKHLEIPTEVDISVNNFVDTYSPLANFKYAKEVGYFTNSLYIAEPEDHNLKINMDFSFSSINI